MGVKNHSESGRTMLEMTAVITVIGLLTVLPLLAIRSASVTANVNNLLSEVRKRALTVTGGTKRHSSHPLTEGLFERESGKTPFLVSGYAVGDNSFPNCSVQIQTAQCGNRVYNEGEYDIENKSCTIAYVPVGICKATIVNSSGTSTTKNYGKKLSADMCKAIFKQIPDAGGGTSVGDIVALRKTATGANLTLAGCSATLNNLTWIGIRIK